MRWPFFLALVLVAAGAPLVLAVPASGETDSSPAQSTTRQDYSAVERTLSSLPAPPGTSRDRYATGCGIPTPYCLIDSRGHLSRLFTDTVSLLLAHGVSVDWSLCWPEARQYWDLAACSVQARYGDVPLLVIADDQTSPLHTKVTPWLAVLDGSDPPAMGFSLPTWGQLGLAAPGWNGAATCARRLETGCRELQGTFIVPGASPAKVAASWQAWLGRAGYRVDWARCHVVGRARTPRCAVTATRYLALGGRDMVTVVAAFRLVVPGGVGITLTAGS